MKTRVFFSFLMVFFLMSVNVVAENYVPVALTLAGPEPVYFIVEDGPDFATLGFRDGHEVEYEYFNDFDGESDLFVFYDESGKIFYPTLGLEKWGTGQLQSWVFKDIEGSWQGWTIFQSGYMMPNRPQPSTALFSMAMAVVNNEEKPVTVANIQPQSKASTTWGKIKNE